MLISFSLSNFKGFKKLEKIDLKPLTIICGANNSGKSSIIQSLLLMKQSTIANRTASLDTQEPLILDGEESAFVHLGDWADMIYKHKTDNKMSLTWLLSDEGIEAEINVDIESINSPNQVAQKLRVSRFQFKELNTSVSFELIKAKHEKYDLKLTGISLKALLYPWVMQQNKWIKKLTQIVIKEIQFNNISVEFHGIFPTSVQGNFAKQSYQVLNQLREENKKQEHIKFVDDIVANLSHFIKKGKNPGKTYLFKPNKKVELSRKHYRLAIQHLREFWLSFRYLGPVREAPQRHYFINKTGQTAIGSKGEYTSIVLAEEQEQPIPPYYRCIYHKKTIKEFEYRSSDRMLEALNSWLLFMQLPQIIPTQLIERTISQIKLDSTGVEVCLPDVGFGVSQILPVLVECLRTKSGETIILEQPEIHLHPSLQSKLADFLICMAKAGKKIIVETHSEHLIKRLYLRAAQDESDQIRPLLNTVFVHFDEQQQTSVTQTIMINEYGEIENWPIGFFDEDDSRELVAATLKKRMGRKK
jgi:predicted ATPase